MTTRNKIASTIQQNFDKFSTNVKVSCPPKSDRIKVKGPLKTVDVCIHTFTFMSRPAFKLCMCNLWKEVIGGTPP